jgi:hypothetical protein
MIRNSESLPPIFIQWLARTVFEIIHNDAGGCDSLGTINLPGKLPC